MDRYLRFDPISLDFLTCGCKKPRRLDCQESPRIDVPTHVCGPQSTSKPFKNVSRCFPVKKYIFRHSLPPYPPPPENPRAVGANRAIGAKSSFFAKNLENPENFENFDFSKVAPNCFSDVPTHSPGLPRPRNDVFDGCELPQR